MAQITRRRALAALAPLLGAGAVRLAGVGPADGTVAAAATGHGGHGGHGDGALAGLDGFRAGRTVDHAANGFHPTALLRDFDTGRARRVAGGRVVREFELVAQDRTIEVAPGVRFDAWTYNGRVPAPTLRAREGERVRVTLINGSAHPHTIHFHGLHNSFADGVPGLGAGVLAPGKRTVYEFDAEPFGLHLYHCHTPPLATHIAKGLYGAFIIDPKQGRPDADEMVMVLNGFDTNFDRSNEVYGANSIPFAYMHEPIRVQRDRLVRIYVANVLEFDLINSLHVHGNFFHVFPTGTSLEPSEFTDTVMLCQGQRAILEMRFPHAGKVMFHAHQSEFTELGWMGFFDVQDGRIAALASDRKAALHCEVTDGSALRH